MRPFLLISVIAGSACASGPQQHLAVFPEAWVTPEPGGIDAAATLAEGLDDTRGLSLSRVPAADIGEVEESCIDEPVCAQRVGSERNADAVVGLKLASLGTTVLVSARLVDVSSGATVQAWQRIVQAEGQNTVQDAVLGIAADVAQRYEQPLPWRRRWYVWTISALVLGGAALAVGLAAAPAPASPDVVVTPP